ncbi:peptide-methionine (S)-S-oxide reductase MsrA [Polaribacter undariae]|uniref:Peptide methionine sulfoxide reductase MsrA n=1 Tax=Polaribacter sejongensis TaxID=985043 RepID=A0AAJ1QWC1_9FLAO|nr:peptide-methionine (S)-S-oxide reductase MsrA [Polaribacter undariae]MDN3619534.1 peptide-methionine (S)-S-oxide reductase MsrA [Polaribacter undariae]UWD32351.1 peptide-methionine (S)-S-oxide reductase MsrA [Polaribacter undariae]
MNILKSITFLSLSILLISCFGFTDKKETQTVTKATYIANENTKVAYFASGCFWCVEAIFESVSGVEEAVSGYAGGHTLNPTYKSIGTGKTGHSETVAVYYNPEKVSFETLVTVFFGSQDPTTKNGQHPDYGTQYRSIAFYETDAEKAIIEKMITKLNAEVYHGKIATEVTKLKKFYKAEDYHQDFERRNPNQGYIKAVSIPRLNKFKKKFPQLLKTDKH